MKIILISVVGILLALPLLVFAGGLVPCGGKFEPECDLCDFIVLARELVKFLTLTLATPLATIALLIGGSFILFGGANPSHRETGKKILGHAIIGLIIAFAAWVIVDAVLGNLLDPGYIPMWQSFPGCPGHPG